MASIEQNIMQGFSTIGEFGFGFSPETSPIDPRIVAIGVIRIILSMVGFFFFLLMLYAGYLWITAYGEEEKIKQSLKLSRAAVLGLLVVIGSYAITVFVFYMLTRAAGGIFYNPSNPTYDILETDAGY